MLSDIEVIDGAIELVSADGGWCKGAFCRDKDGNAVNTPATSGLPVEQGYSAKPVSFCLEGALGHVNGYFLTSSKRTDEKRLNQWFYLCDLVKDTVEGDWYSLHRFNDADRTSQEDAVLALKLTRSHLEEQG